MKIEHVGVIVKAKRKELGMTRRMLASLSFVSEMHIKKVEQGKRNMGQVVKESIYKVLGLNMGDEYAHKTTL